MNNSRNGYSPKTVQGSVGKVYINVPRDKAGDFVPVLIKKYQTDISSIEDKIIFLYPPERIDARYPPRR
ncbi:transposase [Synergistes jonesii]|uniref:transposase n=1 Tax=Synergistes jonesii TaxID=2754 RepID=UPI003C6FED4B